MLVHSARRFGGDFDAAKLRALCVAHVRGLAWCAHYYYHGCADWRWHFGFHYAPYAHDLAAVAAELAAAADGPWAGGAAGDVGGGAAGSESIGAWGGEGPLRPVQQLAAVLPLSSASALLGLSPEDRSGPPFRCCRRAARRCCPLRTGRSSAWARRPSPPTTRATCALPSPPLLSPLVCLLYSFPPPYPFLSLR